MSGLEGELPSRRCGLGPHVLVLVLGCAACAAPSTERVSRRPADASARTVSAADRSSAGVADRVEVSLAPPIRGDLGPEILLPAQDREDAVVAQVGDVQLRSSDVFARMMQTSRRGARNLIDLMIIDAVVAAQAQRYGIVVDAKAIDALVAEEEGLLRERVKIEWGGRKEFEDYVESQFDLGVDEYRQFLRIELARERYRSLVIRFLALLEDRVEVRVLAHRDRKVVDDAALKVRDGADFSTLAFRESEDETRNDGGRMPPFSRAFEHPIAQVAFSLAPGELSKPFLVEAPAGGGGPARWCLVYCLNRMPARDGVKFAEVRDEIVQELETRALTSFEQKAFALRWCGDSAPALPSGADGR